MDRDEILRELMALDFVAVDLQLYLDTHPHDAQALEKYNSVLLDAQAYRERYEKLCGPLYCFRSFQPEAWKWIDDPWPWQKRFNIDLPEGCC